MSEDTRFAYYYRKVEIHPLTPKLTRIALRFMCANRQTDEGSLPNLRSSGLAGLHIFKCNSSKDRCMPGIHSRCITPKSINKGIEMNTLNITMITLAVAAVFSTGAMAQNISNNDYKAGKDKISVEHKSAKAGCASLSSNAKDICIAQADGKNKVALAELQVSYTPSVKTRYEVRIAQAEADYAVAKERCDDQAGNAKDVCVKEAKAVETTAKADATAQMKTTDANMTANEKTNAANATANEKTSAAKSKASEKKADARKEAAADKTDAEYAVAKEKCDAQAGVAKDTCLNQAKARFGKS